jgi:hypothetical protein
MRDLASGLEQCYAQASEVAAERNVRVPQLRPPNRKLTIEKLQSSIAINLTSDAMSGKT